MRADFDPREIEQSAQAAWAAGAVYRVTEDAERPKFYACSMLPYPSGRLHMGHVRNYTINDMLARHLRMTGMNVLMPMGWDAFGLPAENAAMKNGVPPAKWTRDNIAAMKAQMQAMGLAIDWSREIATCDPGYYKWNQWMFLKMLEAGIAERRTQTVNWDPVDQTVLANEQVIEGRGWRSNAIVEKREIPGYYLKITQYAEELLEHVRTGLPGWPERVKTMQENWIGRSEGVRFAFPHRIRGADGKLIGDGRLYVFTTRADTIMGVTFCAVAPEHPLALHAAASNPEVAAFLASCKAGGTTEAELATQAKRGIATGLVVEHPLSHEPIPLWIGNYVLISYGDGAVMGVPAHDERDFEFARTYGIDLLQVIHIDGEHFSYDRWQEWYARTDGAVTINSDVYSGLDHEMAVDAVAAALEHRGLGGKQTTWRLRDWGISRQRYWGTPIPIIHCEACGVVPVPEKDLPVVLPENLIPDGSGNPLARDAAFLNVPCPSCGRPARRETDTMDTFVDSSWYFMRYCDPQLETAMVGPGTKYWMPMDQYIGGIEHAILHLLYARFWTKVMRDLKLVEIDEPFTRLLTQGMVLNHVWARPTPQGGIEYFPPDEVTPEGGSEGRPSAGRLRDGSTVEYRGMLKMGKTERNGVDPQDLIDRYGADTARLFVMFASPPEQTLDWNNAGVAGANRFLKRLWSFAGRHVERIVAPAAQQSPRGRAGPLRHEMHSLLRQVSYDYERMQYNTVVSGAQKMLNALEAHAAGAAGSVADASVVREGLGILLRVLYPVCPHTTWRLWNELGFDAELGPLLDAPWPLVDEAALVQDEIELMLQINGKLRGKIKVAAAADERSIEDAALASPEFAKFAEGQPVKRVKVVPGRLVNVVV
ncbi:MAG TPA: leucine--tRNA ligase [Caldimonas sp.]|jgi:leucyl-tRNA synthetase|nr:leucine--tRNA ligase [Caldimonas sp.]HEX2540965.1 leucine--tRNA ligase [Caldimonas sp.]